MTVPDAEGVFCRPQALPLCLKREFETAPDAGANVGQLSHIIWHGQSCPLVRTLEQLSGGKAWMQQMTGLSALVQPLGNLCPFIREVTDVSAVLYEDYACICTMSFGLAWQNMAADGPILHYPSLK